MTELQAGVDVVILSWNRGEDTADAIRSSLKQEDVEVHVWVVDQGSEPACVEMLRGFQRRGEIHLLELGNNVGLPQGRNIGMGLGTAPFVVGMDNDAVFDSPHALRQVADKFTAEPELGIIAFRVQNYSDHKDDPKRWPYPRSLRSHRDQQFWTTRFQGGGHAIRREALQQTRGYDPDLVFNWEELDLSYQVIEAGYRILYEPSIVVLHKLSPEARFRWEDKRFYYLVRNALYLDYKYYRKWPRVIVKALGYAIKGTWNGLLGATLSAIKDALTMSRHIDPGIRPLGRAAIRYIDCYDRAPRGSIARRIKDEVFESLPR